MRLLRCAMEVIAADQPEGLDDFGVDPKVRYESVSDVLAAGRDEAALVGEHDGLGPIA